MPTTKPQDDSEKDQDDGPGPTLALSNGSGGHSFRRLPPPKQPVECHGHTDCDDVAAPLESAVQQLG
jgi:hypothetical protein